MKKSEVWLVNLAPTLGAEMSKTRPVVIVNNDTIGRLPLKVIVPITDWKEHYLTFPWMVKIQANDKNGLNKNSAADGFQIRSSSENRFFRKLGTLENQEMQEIKSALDVVLEE